MHLRSVTSRCEDENARGIQALPHRSAACHAVHNALATYANAQEQKDLLPVGFLWYRRYSYLMDTVELFWADSRKKMRVEWGYAIGVEVVS
jgi:hypothetical protein